MKPIKTVTLCIALIAITYAARATVRTVSNNANSPGQYTSLQAAHDAAANGDTLYIHPSPSIYGGITLIKKLTLIGEGVMPNRQVRYCSEVGTIILSFATFPASSSYGSKIFGLKVNDIIFNNATQANSYLIGEITVSRCRIVSMMGNTTYGANGSSSGAYIGSSNNVFTQNIIGSIGMFLVNSSVSNNIIQNVYIDGGSTTAAVGNSIVSNNIIQSGMTASGDVVVNNIFYNYSSSGTIGGGSTNGNKGTVFTKNLFYAGIPVTTSYFISGSNTGTGNLFQQDPLFVTPILPNTLYNYSYTTPVSGPFADLHLLATSPGKNYGTDSTDIGIYGGSYPWVDGDSTDSRFRYFAMPNQVPHMISMDVLNPALPQSGTLNVNFNARTQP